MNRVAKCLLLVSGLLFTATSNAAVGLERVGPNDSQNGYPLWYQDKQGLALDLCIPKSVAQLGACLADPPLSYPLEFPVNWPDELFWYGADAALTLNLDGNIDGNKAILVQAIEAAFGGLGTPSAGDQIVFARIRIRFNAPAAGDYTVIYPYGDQEFLDVAEGELIFYTDDVGIGAAGDFTGAMTGEVGPFLRAVDAITGGLSDFVQIDGDTFLADPTIETAVTGSLLGRNYFEVCFGNREQCLGTDPGSVHRWRTDQFALIGKVHTAPIGSPMQVTSATFSRENIGGDISVNVHATAVSGPGSADPVLTLAMVNQPSVLMEKEAFGAYRGKYYAPKTIQSPIDEFGLVVKPDDVTVINSSDSPASSVKVRLVDIVTITNATMDAISKVLNIQANSSDVEVEKLHVGIVVRDASGKLVPATASFTEGEKTDPPIKDRTIETGYQIPPETVTVTSSAFGSATTSLTIICGGCQPGDVLAGAPLAVNDTVDTVLCDTVPGSACIFDILSNDGDEASPGTVVLVDTPVNGPFNGTASVNVVLLEDDTVIYTPSEAGITDSFKYTVSNADGLSSNVATVIINPDGAAPTPPPVVEPPPADPEDLAVTRAECRNRKNEWRVNGTSSILTPHSVKVYAGPIGGTVIADNVQVDNLGAWSARSKSGGPCVDTVSIESSEGAVLIEWPVRVR